MCDWCRPCVEVAIKGIERARPDARDGVSRQAPSAGQAIQEQRAAPRRTVRARHATAQPTAATAVAASAESSTMTTAAATHELAEELLHAVHAWLGEGLETKVGCAVVGSSRLGPAVQAPAEGNADRRDHHPSHAGHHQKASIHTPMNSPIRFRLPRAEPAVACAVPWVPVDCLTAGGGNMLAAELKRHEAQVAAGDAPPPQLPPRNLGPTLGTVKASAVSQSLPSTSHLQKMGAYPPKPRVRPSAPSFSVLPILELPEPSPLSNSLLDPADRPSPELTSGDPEGEETGGTSLFALNNSPPSTSFVYGASAPATMLWGAHAHRYVTRHYPPSRRPSGARPPPPAPAPPGPPRSPRSRPSPRAGSARARWAAGRPRGRSSTRWVR